MNRERSESAFQSDRAAATPTPAAEPRTDSAHPGDSWIPTTATASGRLVRRSRRVDAVDNDCFAPLRRTPVIRRITAEELKQRGERIDAMAKSAPESGFNLWQARHPELDATVYLLGTQHGLYLTNIREWPRVISFLSEQEFTHVLSETTGAHDDRAMQLPDANTLVSKLKNKAELTAEAGKEATPEKRRRIILGLLANIRSITGSIDDVKLDSAYVALALNGKGRRSKRSILDSPEVRDAASQKNSDDGVAEASKNALAAKAGKPETEKQQQAVPTGDQRTQFLDDAQEKLAGLDIANTEERNKRWVEGTAVAKGDRQVWIVGAAHLAGLILRFEDLGWKVVHGP